MRYLLRTKSGSWFNINLETGKIDYTSKIKEECFLEAEDFRTHNFKQILKKNGAKTKLYSYNGAKKNTYQLSDMLLISTNAKQYIASGAFELDDNRTKTTITTLTNDARSNEKTEMGIKTGFNCQIDSIEVIANESNAQKAEKPVGSVQAILSSITNAKELLDDEKNYDNYVLTEVDRLITDTLHYISLYQVELSDEMKLKLFDLLQGAVKRRTEVHVNEQYRGLLSTMLSSKTENVLELLSVYQKLKDQKYVPRTMMDFFNKNGKAVAEPYVPTYEEWAKEILVNKKDNFSSSETLKNLEKAESEEKKMKEYTLFDLFPEFCSELEETENPREAVRRLTKLLEGNKENETRDVKKHNGRQRNVTVDVRVGKDQRSQLSTYEDENGILHFAGSTMTAPAFEFRQLISEIQKGLISHDDAASALGMKLPNFEALFKTYVRNSSAFAKQQVIKANKKEFEEFKQWCLDNDVTIQQLISALLRENIKPEMLKLEKSEAKVSNVFLRVDDYKDFHGEPENKGKDLSLCLGELVHEFVEKLHENAEVAQKPEPVNPKEFLEKHPDTVCPICGGPMKALKKYGGVIECKDSKCGTKVFASPITATPTEKDIEEVLKLGKSTTLISVLNPVWFGTDETVEGVFELKDTESGHELAFVRKN